MHGHRFGICHYRGGCQVGECVWVCVCGCVLSPSAFSKSTRHFELLVNREHTQLTTWPHTHTHTRIPHTQKQCTMNEKFKACCIIKWKALENYRGQRGQNLKSTGELWRQTKALAFPLSPYLSLSFSLSLLLTVCFCLPQSFGMHRQVCWQSIYLWFASTLNCIQNWWASERVSQGGNPLGEKEPRVEL